MKRFLLIINSIMPFFAALLIRSFLYSVIAEGYILITGITKITTDAQYYLSIISMVICGVIFFYWFMSLLPKVQRMPASKVISVRNIILLALLGVGCQFLISGILSILKPFFDKIFSDYSNTMSSIFSGNQMVVMFYIVILAPLVEELIFRGIILEKLRLPLPFLGANLLQAAIFGIYHWDLVQSTYAFLNGLLLGYIYYKFKSLIAPILLHMIINASSYLIMMTPTVMPMYIAAIAGGGILIFITLFQISKGRT